MNVTDLYKLFLENPTVTTDSRVCPKKSIFFALKGENFDGNLFAEKALENGASYAIIDNPTQKKDDRFILVDDALNTSTTSGLSSQTTQYSYHWHYWY